MQKCSLRTGIIVYFFIAHLKLHILLLLVIVPILTRRVQVLSALLGGGRCV